MFDDFAHLVKYTGWPDHYERLWQFWGVFLSHTHSTNAHLIWLQAPNSHELAEAIAELELSTAALQQSHQSIQPLSAPQQQTANSETIDVDGKTNHCMNMWSYCIVVSKGCPKCCEFFFVVLGSRTIWQFIWKITHYIVQCIRNILDNP